MMARYEGLYRLLSRYPALDPNILDRFATIYTEEAAMSVLNDAITLAKDRSPTKDDIRIAARQYHKRTAAETLRQADNAASREFTKEPEPIPGVEE
jgi:hypothetical protein